MPKTVTIDQADQHCIDKLKVQHSHESWKWYGYAGHLIVSRRCAYHLCTRVGNYLVSTVGAYYQDPGDDKLTPVGSGSDEFFETFVFVCSGEHDGDPIVKEYVEIFGVRYNNSLDAELGHYETCWKYHNKD